LGPLLAVVQLLPALALARDSVRSAGLSLEELTITGFLDWAGFRGAFDARTVRTPLVVVPCMLAAVGVVVSRDRRRALFHLTAGLLFFMLAFGPTPPVFRLYRLLPFGRLFSEPQKFLWVTDFCLAVLAGLGTQAIAVEAGSRKRLLAAVAAA